MQRPKPRTSKVSVPLPEDAALPPDVRKRLSKLPPLNNLRMFANVPQCFRPITDLINALFHDGRIDPKLREYMYLRIAIKYGLYYEYRHNLFFSEQLGITTTEIAPLRCNGVVDQFSHDDKLVCKAAEEITESSSASDETLSALLDRFGSEGPDGFIDDLYVRPGYRRQGLGREALRALFAECERRRVLAVHVEAGRNNIAAQALYRSFGLRVLDDTRANC
jgi:ribosomal protein S18 acetylase RimI-like enzyme